MHTNISFKTDDFSKNRISKKFVFTKYKPLPGFGCAGKESSGRKLAINSLKLKGFRFPLSTILMCPYSRHVIPFRRNGGY